MRKLVLEALNRSRTPRPPVWLMRQAGRYLPEYREIRARVGGFLDLCYTPELATEVTLQPVRRYGLDAAILFSDILVVADGLGCPVAFVEGAGPRLEPVRDSATLARLDAARMTERLAPVYETVRRVVVALPPETALIGFAGAPWTVAAYMVEGEGSREFLKARALARRDPELFGALIDLLTEATTAHLVAQIEAGAEVVQIFDSWAGVLPETEFERWCVQPITRIVAAIKQVHPRCPVIVFPRGAGPLYARIVRAMPVDGIGLDTCVPLAWARSHLGGVCLQGNLDPVALLAGGAVLRSEAERILTALEDVPFIFNLGHGVLPETDPAAVGELVDLIKASKRRERSSKA